MPVEGSIPNELNQIQAHYFVNLLFIVCFTSVYLSFAHTNDIVYIFLVNYLIKLLISLTCLIQW